MIYTPSSQAFSSKKLLNCNLDIKFDNSITKFVYLYVILLRSKFFLFHDILRFQWQFTQKKKSVF